MTAKTGQDNNLSANCPRTASRKGTYRSTAYFQKTGAKVANAVRRSLHYCETDGRCGQQGRSTNTRTDCEKAQTQPQTQQCYRQLEDSRQNYGQE